MPAAPEVAAQESAMVFEPTEQSANGPTMITSFPHKFNFISDVLLQAETSLLIDSCQL